MLLNSVRAEPRVGTYVDYSVFLLTSDSVNVVRCVQGCLSCAENVISCSTEEVISSLFLKCCSLYQNQPERSVDVYVCVFVSLCICLHQQ